MSEENQSPSIAALSAALSKAQGQMSAAKKDSVNPHFRSKYADLASIWEACREPLTNNGLAVMQRVSTSDGGVVVTTMLVHSSGEYVRDACTFPVAQRTPQGYGSALTYARRYALASLVGVASDDDDGEEASKQTRNGPATNSLKAQVLAAAPKLPANPGMIVTKTGPMPEPPDVRVVNQAPQESQAKAELKAKLQASGFSVETVKKTPFERIKEIGNAHGFEGKALSDRVKKLTGKGAKDPLTDDDVAKVAAAFEPTSNPQTRMGDHGLGEPDFHEEGSI